MNIVKLSDTIAVSGQVQAADMARVADAGYRVVVNNRPDGEEPGQPRGAEIAAAAEAAGLQYYYMPVSHGDFPGADFDAFSGLLDDPDSPVFAFCRSGTRCANLWVASRHADQRDEAIAAARSAGFDLGFAALYLSRD